ncbi:MAG: undecaprenyldiphospho-muramoylpentapeptide beta-N-acetylglucosaminyltransferase [Patescibacteria group bacterium]
MRILFTGGGTGGHIFPIVAVARQLNKIYQSAEQTETLEMYFLGAGGLTDILIKEGIKVKTILAGKMRRYFSLMNIVDLFKLPISLIQAFFYLYFWMPDVIFSKGGYGSLSVVLVAWLYRIPVLVHESDTIPGLANKLGGKLAKRVAVGFVSAEKYFSEKRTAFIGNPIRPELAQLCLAANQENIQKARTFFGLNEQKPIIFIVGGSQGAQAINELVLIVLPKLLEKYQVIHQVGNNNLEQVKLILGQNLPTDYHIYGFLEENQMAAAYLLADLIVSRAGAGTISEIAICAKPSILIPLPQSAGDHQRSNAFAYAQAGAATVVEQSNLTPNIFLGEIIQILDNPELKQKMAANAKNFSQPEAAIKIVQELIEICQ